MATHPLERKSAPVLGTLFALLMASETVEAQTPSSPEQVVRANAEAWSRGDTAGILALFADDGRSYDRSTDPHKLAGETSRSIGTKAQLAAYLDKASAAPPARETITDIAAMGDLVVAAGESAQPPGYAKRMQYLSAYRVREGQIRDLWHIAWIPATVAAKDDPTTVIRRLIDANNARDADGFLALFSPDAKNFRYIDDPRTLAPRPSATIVDAASREKKYRELFATTAVQVKPVRLFAVGDLVVEHSHVTGFADAPAKVVNEISIYRIKDGRIVDDWFLGEETLVPAGGAKP